MTYYGCQLLLSSCLHPADARGDKKLLAVSVVGDGCCQPIVSAWLNPKKAFCPCPVWMEKLCLLDATALCVLMPVSHLSDCRFGDLFSNHFGSVFNSLECSEWIFKKRLKEFH